MRPFADTNWLVANYFSIDPARVAVVHRFTGKWDYPWHLAPITQLECENTFANLAGMPNSKEWQQFQSHLGTKLLDAQGDWSTVVRKTRRLIQQFSHKARLGTGDLMFLASALEGEATHLLSFDINSNLRALAAVLKLKVFPDLTPDDKSRMAAFR